MTRRRTFTSAPTGRRAIRPGLLPGCPGAAPLHDHALLPWRFHPSLHAADGFL
ncbi:hypothetical protein V3328_25025 [Microbaculum marinum]|uniref:Uncharacterized protein n=1 Tax=Microbaculum marinum TaxID=1764581 RepID=A0AAW9RWV2_9HYPH